MTNGCTLSAPAASAPLAAPRAPRLAGAVTWSDGLILFTPGAIWGASFLFIAQGLDAMGPAGVAFFRILVGCATLALVPAARRPLPPSAWPRIALLGVVWFALPLSLLPLAEQRVSSALTGMLHGAAPLIAALVAGLVGTLPRVAEGAAGPGSPRRAFSPRVAAGIAVGLAGAALVALPGLGEGRSSATGVLLVLAALVSYGFAITLAAPLQRAHGALPVLARALAVAAVLTAPLGLPAVAAARWTPVALLSLLALGALGTGLAFVLAATAAGRLGPTRASATAFVIPAMALALGVTVRGEAVAPLAVAGAAVSLAGVWLVRRAKGG